MLLANITLRSWLLLALMLPLAFAARLQNRDNVFVANKIYFVDGDCYSRMTRVRMILDHPFQPIHHHSFENYPEGTKAHTTAPMDYLIALLAGLLKPLTSLPVDMAGAFISPLLGCATIVFLWLWGIRMGFRNLAPMLILFAISPILVHGTALGRPDHQSLLILLLAIAIGSEWKISKDVSNILTSARADQVVSGLAWGTGLWVSFYEPLILLAATAASLGLFNRKALLDSGRKAWLCAFLIPLVLMLLVDGIPFELPGPANVQTFLRWKTTIGELTSLPPLSPLLFRWTGFFLFVSPLLLLRTHGKANRTFAPLFLLVSLYLLTLWQIRWGYFLALVFAMTLPWQFQALQKRWLIWLLFAASLWPILLEWDQRLFPDENRADELANQRAEWVFLRDLAEQLGTGKTEPILAPWWMCPAVAYWSGQPTIAGTSHESLPGILDTARFYLSQTPSAAEKILKKRQVKWVLVCEPSRIVQTSKNLVEPCDPEKALVTGLWEHPHTTPPFLQLRATNPLFKLFSVSSNQL